MRTQAWVLCAGLILSGCTGAAAQVHEETAVIADGTAKSSGSGSKATTDGAQAMKKSAERIYQGCKDAGYTVSDYDQELHEVSFDATNGSSFLGVEVRYIQNAKSAYDHDRLDDDVTVQDEYTDGGMSLCVLRDLEDNTYEVLGVNQETDLLYEVDDIRSEDLGTVKHILGLAGLPGDQAKE